MSDQLVVYILTALPPAGYVVRVQRGEELLVAETYPNLDTADTRAVELRLTLEDFGWQNTRSRETNPGPDEAGRR